MDLAKIGKFIAERRKAKNLTQAKLGEIIGVSEKTVSKWECGKGFADTSLILPLCQALDITSNELLCGKTLSSEEYKNEAEKSLIELSKKNVEKDKLLLRLEWIIGGFSVLILLIATMCASYIDLSEHWRIIIIATGLVICLVGVGFAVIIEKDAGYYECAHCKHRYVPTLNAVVWSMHFGRTRYMKCPKCGKKSWQKKRVKEYDEDQPENN